MVDDDIYQLGKKGEPISALDMREVLREKLGIDMLPENSHDLSEVFRNEDTWLQKSEQIATYQEKVTSVETFTPFHQGSKLRH